MTKYSPTRRSHILLRPLRMRVQDMELRRIDSYKSRSTVKLHTLIYLTQPEGGETLRFLRLPIIRRAARPATVQQVLNLRRVALQV